MATPVMCASSAVQLLQEAQAAGASLDIATAQAAAASLPDPVPATAPYARTVGDRKGVSSFVAKTYAMVSEPASDAQIAWTPEGTSFVVSDPDVLALHVFPRFFKHTNFQSFIRQLNMYGFHKVGSDTTAGEFYHDGFRRGCVELLPYIKRRSAAAKAASASAARPVAAVVSRELTTLKRQRDELRADVAALVTAQETMDAQLAAVVEENTALRADLAASLAAHASMRKTVAAIMDLVGGTAPAVPALDDDAAFARPTKRQRTLAPPAAAAPLPSPPSSPPSSFYATLARSPPQSIRVELPPRASSSPSPPAPPLAPLAPPVPPASPTVAALLAATTFPFPMIESPLAPLSAVDFAAFLPPAV